MNYKQALHKLKQGKCVRPVGYNGYIKYDGVTVWDFVAYKHRVELTQVSLERQLQEWEEYVPNEENTEWKCVYDTIPKNTLIKAKIFEEERTGYIKGDMFNDIENDIKHHITWINHWAVIPE